AKPVGRSQAVATIPTSVAHATCDERSGRPATTGTNWWSAPSTAVVRNASMPTCTADTAPGCVGDDTRRSAANHTANPNPQRPTAAAARNASGIAGGGAVTCGTGAGDGTGAGTDRDGAASAATCCARDTPTPPAPLIFLF